MARLYLNAAVRPPLVASRRRPWPPESARHTVRAARLPRPPRRARSRRLRPRIAPGRRDPTGRLRRRPTAQPHRRAARAPLRLAPVDHGPLLVGPLPTGLPAVLPTTAHPDLGDVSAAPAARLGPRARCLRLTLADFSPRESFRARDTAYHWMVAPHAPAPVRGTTTARRNVCQPDSIGITGEPESSQATQGVAPMADRVLRGSRLGAVSYETDRNHDLAPRQMRGTAPTTARSSRSPSPTTPRSPAPGRAATAWRAP